jgi:hypothetical protein
MTRERMTWASTATCLVLVLIFVTVGSRTGVRAVGLVGIAGAISVMRASRIGVGIDGYEPSFYLKGKTATVISILMMILFASMVLVPAWLLNHLER